jgi:hypothetical protein
MFRPPPTTKRPFQNSSIERNPLWFRLVALVEAEKVELSQTRLRARLKPCAN